MTVRTLKITNAYEDGAEFTSVETVEVESYDEEYLDELLFPLTGVGPERSSYNACYVVQSIDRLDPPIYMEWC